MNEKEIASLVEEMGKSSRSRHTTRTSNLQIWQKKVNTQLGD